MSQTATAMKPGASEYAPYYEKYVSLVTESDVIEAMNNSLTETLELLHGLNEEKANFRYAPDKWSIKQVLGHICDTERIFVYRALRFARGDKTELAGFDQDYYVPQGKFDDASLTELLDEFEAIRRASITLFKRLDDEALQRAGLANGNEISVRALAHIIVGHERHHLSVIRERYLT